MGRRRIINIVPSERAGGERLDVTRKELPDASASLLEAISSGARLEANSIVKMHSARMAVVGRGGGARGR